MARLLRTDSYGCLCIYPIGVPLWYLAMLWRKRTRINPSHKELQAHLKEERRYGAVLKVKNAAHQIKNTVSLMKTQRAARAATANAMDALDEVDDGDGDDDAGGGDARTEEANETEEELPVEPACPPKEAYISETVYGVLLGDARFTRAFEGYGEYPGTVTAWHAPYFTVEYDYGGVEQVTPVVLGPLLETPSAPLTALATIYADESEGNSAPEPSAELSSIAKQKSGGVQFAIHNPMVSASEPSSSEDAGKKLAAKKRPTLRRFDSSIRMLSRRQLQVNYDREAHALQVYHKIYSIGELREHRAVRTLAHDMMAIVKRDNDTTIKHLRFLFEPYKPHCWLVADVRRCEHYARLTIQPRLSPLN